MDTKRTWGWTGLLLAGIALGAEDERGGVADALRCGVEQVPPPPAAPEDGSAGPGWVTAVDPKPLGAAARKGLAWLLATQREDGGWGQGEESAHMGRREGGDVSNVADSCMSLLALVRAGGLEAGSPYRTALERGLAFVCGEIEEADEESLYVTGRRGTRVQSKIGTYVDTFAASMTLAEVVGQAGPDVLGGRVDAALAKVLRKIQHHQRQDGGWEGSGWAPVLSLSLAGKGLNRAKQAGAEVDGDALLRSLGYFESYDAAAPAGAAGIALYGSSAALGGLQESANTNAVRERELKDELAKATGEERQRIESELVAIADGRRAQQTAQDQVVGRLADPSFVSGFGSNGGEEFLSYMNISESLVVRADEAWTRWDGAMANNLARIQNEDGSWSGHHCITGRNFCTAAALLVLMADRTPVPAEVVAAEPAATSEPATSR